MFERFGAARRIDALPGRSGAAGDPVLPTVAFVSTRLEESIVGPMTHAPRLRSLAELRARLDEMPDAPPGTRRGLALRGHSTRGGRLLRLGDVVVDMTVPEVDCFFQRLAADRVLPRLGIVAVCLLGCGTASEPAGRLTIRLLAHVLGVRVFGTRKRLQKAHYTRTGLDPAFAHLLLEAADLPQSRLPPLEDDPRPG